MNTVHKVYGYSGLVPFVTLAVAIKIWPQTDFLLTATLAYGALIYSFIGGLYWQLSLTATQYKTTVASVAIAVMLWAWTWLIVDWLQHGWLLAISFWALPIFEKYFLRDVWPASFVLLRQLLSFFAGLSLLSLSF